MRGENPPNISHLSGSKLLFYLNFFFTCTGGYTMSMYSKYNSITPSAVYGYERMPNSGEENNGFIDDKLAGNYALKIVMYVCM